MTDPRWHEPCGGEEEGGLMNQLKCRWVVKETADPGGGTIQICTEDDRMRIFVMAHSSFGPSSYDMKIAKHVVDLHNASLVTE